MKDNIMIVILIACLYFLVTGKLDNTCNVRTLNDNVKKLSKKIKTNKNQINYIKREMMLP